VGLFHVYLKVCLPTSVKSASAKGVHQLEHEIEGGISSIFRIGARKSGGQC
jgi:hypothetical protein